MKLIQFNENVLIAGPNVSDKNMETVRNVQSIRPILSRMAQQIREALKTEKPNQKIVPILERGKNELTKILPKIKDKFVQKMTGIVIENSQKLIGTLSNSGRNEVEDFLKKGMHDFFFAHIENSYLEDKNPGNSTMFFGY